MHSCNSTKLFDINKSKKVSKRKLQPLVQKGIFTFKRHYICHECTEMYINSGNVSGWHVIEDVQIVNNGSGSVSHNVSEEADIGNSKSSNALLIEVTEEE